MEREAFFIYETFPKFLLEARLGASTRLQASPEEGLGVARCRVGVHECLLNTFSLIWSKAQTLEPGWFHVPPPPLTRSLGKPLKFSQHPHLSDGG